MRLDWFTADNTATARQAIAATGPELVGLVVNLLTPLISAILLPAVIALALLPVSWQLGVAALAGVPLLLGALWASARLARRADAAAGVANSALTERIIEFARTQQALRAARRVEPARSLVGYALAAQHSATMRLLGMQIPGQLLFSIASQLALILLAGATTALTVDGTLTVAEAIALIVVIARYLEPFTTISELAPALEAPAPRSTHPFGADRAAGERRNRSLATQPRRRASSSTTSCSATTARAHRCSMGSASPCSREPRRRSSGHRARGRAPSWR